MDMPIINAVVFEAMGTKRSHPFKEKGNKYTHGQRVAALALTLRERIFPGDASRDEILTVAAWVHDIMNGIENHAEQGAARARALLSPHCSAEELDDICGIIANPPPKVKQPMRNMQRKMRRSWFMLTTPALFS